jgi:hypothetical protein
VADLLLAIEQQCQGRQRQVVLQVLRPPVEDQRAVAVDEPGVELRLPEGATGGQVVEKLEVGDRAADTVFTQGARQALQGAIT